MYVSNYVRYRKIFSNFSNLDLFQNIDYGMIYKQGTVSSRVKRIEELGAIVKVTDVSYDETVELARRMATLHNWIFIQDTTMENYLVSKSKHLNDHN